MTGISSFDTQIAKPAQVSSKELANVFHVVSQHHEPVQPEPPGKNGILHSQRNRDFGSEYAHSPKLKPLLRLVKINHRLERRFRVRKVSRPEFNVVKSKLRIEFGDN